MLCMHGEAPGPCCVALLIGPLIVQEDLGKRTALLRACKHRLVKFSQIGFEYMFDCYV